MTDLIQRITQAIIKQEGMALDHCNPGNLRDAVWFPLLLKAGKPWLDPEKPAYGPVRFYKDTGEHVQYSAPVGDVHRFWHPRSRAEGIAGAAHVVALHIAEGDSLAKLISIWAPASENDTATYLKNVKTWAVIPDENQPLWSYLCQ